MRQAKSHTSDPLPDEQECRLWLSVCAVLRRFGDQFDRYDPEVYLLTNRTADRIGRICEAVLRGEA